MNNARNYSELTAWQNFIEACEDECEIVTVNKFAQSAALKLENDLKRLHEIEHWACKMADIIPRFDFTSQDNDFQEPEKSPHYTPDGEKNYWKTLAEFNLNISKLVPEANIPLCYGAIYLENLNDPA